MSKTKTTVVPESHSVFGLYLWQVTDGRYVGDDQGNFLNIPSKYGDPKKIEQLKQAVYSYGVYEGSPVFFPGHRRVTDEEYSEQVDRLNQGLVPDTEDIGALNDAIAEQHG